MSVRLKIRHIIRRGPKGTWDAENPILLLGEPGYDTTDKVLKIGDGITPWKTLQAMPSKSEVNFLEGEVKRVEELLNLFNTNMGVTNSRVTAIEKESIPNLQSQINAISAGTAEDVENLKVTVERHSTSIADLKADVSELQSNYTNDNEWLEEFKTTTLPGIDSDLHNLATRTTDTEVTVDNLGIKVDGQVTILNGVIKDVASHEGKISTLTTNLNQTDQKAGAAYGAANEALTKINNTIIDVSRLEPRIAVLETDNAAQATSISGMQNTIGSIWGQISTDANRITAVIADVTTLKGEMATVTPLVPRVVALETTMSEVKADNIDNKAWIQELVVNQIPKITSDIITVDNKATNNTVVLTDLVPRVVKLEGEVKKNITDIAALNTSDGHLWTQVNATSERLSDYANNVTKLEEWSVGVDTKLEVLDGHTAEITNIKANLVTIEQDVSHLQNLSDNVEEVRLANIANETEIAETLSKLHTTQADVGDLGFRVGNLERSTNPRLSEILINTSPFTIKAGNFYVFGENAYPTQYELQLEEDILDSLYKTETIIKCPYNTVLTFMVKSGAPVTLYKEASLSKLDAKSTQNKIYSIRYQLVSGFESNTKAAFITGAIYDK